MPRIAIPLDTLPRFGNAAVTLTGIAADAANDHDLENNGNVLLLLENVTAAPVVATVISVKDAYGRIGDITMTAPAAVATLPGKSVAGPFSPPNFNTGGGSRLQIDTAAGVTVRFYALKFYPN